MTKFMSQIRDTFCGEFLSLSYLVYVKRKAGEISRLTLATLLKVENGPIFQFLYLKDVIS